MHSHDPELTPHSHPVVRALLQDCPWLVNRVDLTEGVHYIMNQVAILLRDVDLSEAEMDCVFFHLNQMAEGDSETKNILVVGVLEVLTDTPEAVEMARTRLREGPARLLFERVLNGWEPMS